MIVAILDMDSKDGWHMGPSVLAIIVRLGFRNIPLHVQGTEIWRSL